MLTFINAFELFKKICGELSKLLFNVTIVSFFT